MPYDMLFSIPLCVLKPSDAKKLVGLKFNPQTQ
jgi:hypothetical protein